MERIDININDLLKLYNSGMLLCELGEYFGVNYNVIRNRLIEIGYPLRSISESHKISASRSTPEERRRRAKAAHDAVRGKRQSFEHRCKIAKTREIKQVGITRIERIAGKMLVDYGFSIVFQKAIGKYNVDIAITKPSIAVEIFGGHWHTTGHHAARFRKRIDYIINSGWLPVIIWVTRNYPLEIGAIKYIISLSKKLSSGKTMGSKEHMIRGDGKFTMIGEHKLNNRSGKVSPNPRDNTTGRYTSRI